MSARDDLTRRQLARKQSRVAGDRSARMARELMSVAPSVLGKLELDDDVRASIDEARRITSHIARRRAERALAGDLRGVDLVALEQTLANVKSTGSADSERLRLAEHWRARLLDEGIAAIAELPGGDADHELPRLMAAAQREKSTGKPPGAARALFRHIAEALRASEEDVEEELDDAEEPAEE